MRPLPLLALALLLAACKPHLAVEAAPNRKPQVEGIAHFVLSGADATDLERVEAALQAMNSVEGVVTVAEESRFEITLAGPTRRSTIEAAVQATMDKHDHWTLGWR